MRRLTALVMTFVMMSGCSFALVSGPPANHQQLPAFQCTTSRLGPILDTVFTVIQGSNAIYALAVGDDGWDEFWDYEPPMARGTAIGVYSVLTAIGAAGMWFGFTRTGKCRAAKQELAMRQQQTPPMPMQPTQPGQPPPPGQSGEPWPPLQPAPAGTPPPPDPRVTPPTRTAPPPPPMP